MKIVFFIVLLFNVVTSSLSYATSLSEPKSGKSTKIADQGRTELTYLSSLTKQMKKSKKIHKEISSLSEEEGAKIRTLINSANKERHRLFREVSREIQRMAALGSAAELNEHSDELIAKLIDTLDLAITQEHIFGKSCEYGGEILALLFKAAPVKIHQKVVLIEELSETSPLKRTLVAQLNAHPEPELAIALAVVQEALLPPHDDVLQGLVEQKVRGGWLGGPISSVEVSPLSEAPEESLYSLKKGRIAALKQAAYEARRILANQVQ